MIANILFIFNLNKQSFAFFFGKKTAALLSRKCQNQKGHSYSSGTTCVIIYKSRISL